MIKSKNCNVKMSGNLVKNFVDYLAILSYMEQRLHWLKEMVIGFDERIQQDVDGILDYSILLSRKAKDLENKLKEIDV